MSNLQYNLSVNPNGLSYLIVYDEEAVPHLVNSDHPRWDTIRDGVINDDISVLSLIEVGSSIVRTILSERVVFANNHLFFDNDEISGELVDAIINIIKENGTEASQPLVNFLEKLYQNPSPDSVTQLYRFLKQNKLTITSDGDFIGYKGVYRGTEYSLSPGIGYRSWHAGPAIINGIDHIDGQVPQHIGDVVEIARSQVVNNPDVACAFGLHVATFDFANYFLGSGAVLAVSVNPRDVISVPSDHNDQKVRVCRYQILGEVIEPYTDSIVDFKKSDTQTSLDQESLEKIIDEWYQIYSHYEPFDYGITFINWVEDNYDVQYIGNGDDNATNARNWIEID